LTRKVNSQNARISGNEFVHFCAIFRLTNSAGGGIMEFWGFARETPPPKRKEPNGSLPIAQSIVSVLFSHNLRKNIPL
jgi:hypothetical protein